MSIHRTLQSALAATLILASALAAATNVEVGVVQSVSAEHLILQQKDGTAHIGFIAGPAALRSLKSIKKGQEVRAVFSTATDSRTKAQIGTLLSIRTCATDDAECAADRKRIEATSEKRPEETVASAAKRQQCLQAMEATLVQDPRFGPPLAGGATDEALGAYNNLSGEARTCASKFAGDYHAAYMEACEQHHCGDQVSGGCARLAGRTVHADFHAKAIEKCKQ